MSEGLRPASLLAKMARALLTVSEGSCLHQRLLARQYPIWHARYTCAPYTA